MLSPAVQSMVGSGRDVTTRSTERMRPPAPIARRPRATPRPPNANPRATRASDERAHDERAGRPMRRASPPVGARHSSDAASDALPFQTREMRSTVAPSLRASHRWRARAPRSRSPVLAPLGALAATGAAPTSARITCTKGRYGVVVPNASQRPTAKCTLASCALRRSSSSRRLLPEPGSPMTTTAPPSPSAAAASCSSERPKLSRAAGEWGETRRAPRPRAACARSDSPITRYGVIGPAWPRSRPGLRAPHRRTAQPDDDTPG